MSAHCSPEIDLTPEERCAAIAEILLRGVRRMLAGQKRDKTRRWRERLAATKAAQLDAGDV